MTVLLLIQEAIWITGNTIVAKMSSNDNTLLNKVGEVLISIEPQFKDKICFFSRQIIVYTKLDTTLLMFVHPYHNIT